MTDFVEISAIRPPPSAIYLHIPFCVRRCLYCDFYVLPLGDGPPAKRLKEFRSLKHRRFLQALDAELAGLPDDFLPETVYIGGGTPTEMGPGELARLFDSLARRIDFSRVTEFSCEANPGTLDREMADLLVDRGVNRISLGVQSFVDRTLESLGRIHNRGDAGQAVDLLREAGCRNLSIDLLFGLPDTQPGDLDLNLHALDRLQPDHVSWYSLEYEPGTAFTDMRDRGFLREADEEEIETEYRALRQGLTGLGFEQYELFSFTRPGHACRHNLNYWRGGEYFGCGPSAHSHIGGRRWANRPDLTAYVRHHCDGGDDCTETPEALPSEAKAREQLMTALRIMEGVDADAFATRTGHAIPDLLGPSLQVWRDAGWVDWNGTRLRLLPDAYLISDHLFREFV